MEEVVIQETPPELVRAVVVKIPQPNLSTVFLRLANKLFPLEANTRHLKRIRKMEENRDTSSFLKNLETPVEHGVVARDGVESSTAPAKYQLELLLAVGCSVDAGLLAEFQAVCGDAAPLKIGTAWVPDRAPRTSPDEWTKWCEVWPFAVPKPPLPDRFPPDEMDMIRRLFNEVVMPLASEMRTAQTLGIAAVLVDSLRGWRVLATSNGGGSLHRSNAAAYSGYIPAVVCKEQDDTSKEGVVVLNHPVTYVLKMLASAQCEHFCGTDSVPYLANNIDLLVSHEPCVMCSMALVHSRVRRVFYCFPNLTHGGLGSVFSVHTIPLLNHHFRVFRCSARWLCGAKEHNGTGSLDREGTCCWDHLCDP